MPDKPDQTDPHLNLVPPAAITAILLGMSPGGFDSWLITLKLKTQHLQKALHNRSSPISCFMFVCFSQKGVVLREL